jgi:hypothetical protein
VSSPRRSEDFHRARSQDCSIALGLHISQFPDMAIHVLECVAIHKTVILRIVEGFASRRDLLSNYFIDFLSAFRGQPAR